MNIRMIRSMFLGAREARVAFFQSRTRLSSSFHKQSLRCFTLAELLVAMAIIGLLSALMIPGLNSALEASRSAACASNLKQIGTALLSFAKDHDNEIIRWVDTGPDYWYNVLAKEKFIPAPSASKVWKCPSRNTSMLKPGEQGSMPDNTMTYAINAVWPSASYDGKGGPSYPTGTAYRNKLSILESPSKTIAVCDGNSWLILDSSGVNKGTPAGNHRGGMNAVFWDGHVEHFATLPTNKDPLFSISQH